MFNDFTYDDVYVLTLPAFEWIKVDAQHDPDNGAGRNRHDCSVSIRLSAHWDSKLIGDLSFRCGEKAK
jgi:hypothetical protein